MILYHGSNIEITKIDLSLSKVGKDFGCGFYLSADYEQAKELAERKTEQIGIGTPTISAFEFDEQCLKDASLSVLQFDRYSRDWADFVLTNRQNKLHVPLHNYDIVVGPIANDAVGLQIRKFTSGLISIEQFIKELQYMKGVTMQYFFGTEKAIGCLKRVSL